MVIISGSAKLAHINHELAVPDAKYIESLRVTSSDLPTDKLRELEIARLKQLRRTRAITPSLAVRDREDFEIGRRRSRSCKYGLAYVVMNTCPEELKEAEGQSPMRAGISRGLREARI